MIEAVNAVVSNAPLVRVQTEQLDAAHSVAAAPAATQTVAAGPRAPYISPYIFVDVNHDKAVLQLRDPETGDVVQQFPSDSTLEARRRADAVRAKAVLPDAAAQRASGEGDAQVQSLDIVSDNVSVGLPKRSSSPVQAQIASAALVKTAQITTPTTTGDSVSA